MLVISLNLSLITTQYIYIYEMLEYVSYIPFFRTRFQHSSLIQFLQFSWNVLRNLQPIDLSRHPAPSCRRTRPKSGVNGIFVHRISQFIYTIIYRFCTIGDMDWYGDIPFYILHTDIYCIVSVTRVAETMEHWFWMVNHRCFKGENDGCQGARVPGVALVVSPNCFCQDASMIHP